MLDMIYLAVIRIMNISIPIGDRLINDVLNGDIMSNLSHY